MITISDMPADQLLRHAIEADALLAEWEAAWTSALEGAHARRPFAVFPSVRTHPAALALREHLRHLAPAASARGIAGEPLARFGRGAYGESGAEIADMAAALASLIGKLSATTAAGEPLEPAQQEDVHGLGGPVPHPHDDRLVQWEGHYLHLGRDTAIARLFWLLAKPLGRAQPWEAVLEAVDGVPPLGDRTDDEVRKAAQRMRKAVSKLRERIRGAKLHTHLVIVRGGPQQSAEYRMVWR